MYALVQGSLPLWRHHGFKHQKSYTQCIRFVGLTNSILTSKDKIVYKFNTLFSEQIQYTQMHRITHESVMCVTTPTVTTPANHQTQPQVSCDWQNSGWSRTVGDIARLGPLSVLELPPASQGFLRMQKFHIYPKTYYNMACNG